MSQGVLERIEAELRLLRSMVEEQRGERPRNYEYREAARLIGVHPKTVSKMVRNGELMPIRIPMGRGKTKSMIPVSEIDRICAPQRMESSGASSEQVRFDGAKALAELKALRRGKR